MNNLPIEPNVECRIKSSKGEQTVTARLAQMGVLPGSLLKIVRLGPLGGTVEIVVDEGESIALRKDELATLDCELVALPLSAVTAEGVKCRIRSFLGGRIFRQKMKERGLSEGSIIRLQQGPGFQVVNPENLTATLGRGEAGKIIVEPVEEDG